MKMVRKRREHNRGFKKLLDLKRKKNQNAVNHIKIFLS